MKAALANFQSRPLKDAARQLLAKLGYKSDKFLTGAGSSPQAFLELFSTGQGFDPAKALVSEWKSVDLLFQLTDQELSRELSLFSDTAVKSSLLKSYVFIGIELVGSDYPRGKFSAITRQINRLFPMPVMVFFRHQSRLTIAVINRRTNKLDDGRDVLGKVTLISGIVFAQPHRGHLDILASLALSNLVHPQKKPITDFDTLHAAWEQIFNVELLNERFYRELANWYFWALPQVEFPADLEADDEKRRATGLIRLLTRLIFCWFLKEKNLISEKLFHPTDLAKILKGFDPESETSSTYYQAILQNLFFATLNQRMGKDGNGRPYRAFATDEGFLKNRATHDVNTLYRYEALFHEDPEGALAHFADVPFLNGGLFECLDRAEDGTDKKRYLDGFSRNAKKRPHVPDRLFFDSGEVADLSEVYDDKKRKAERVTGLITILNRYKFTIIENTPIDQEIALDPELLGKVFENLLASYNEETKTTARKQTGSFYTPRPIVDYMVDESLKAHITRALVESARMKEPDARAGLDILFAYTEKEHAFTPAEVTTLIAAIDALKILDPACGSGAFPMGVLHKLVYILGKLDPDNDRWKQTQLAKLDSIPMREELERAFADNNDDYGRKLYLIENCLYGVDIQPIAIQITKLRFFISLVCDQRTNRNKKDNHGIRPLPNLETKFVAADTLIGLPISDKDLFIESLIAPIEKEIEDAYHGHFTIQRRDQKLALQKKIKGLRLKLAETLAGSLGAVNSAKAKHLAEWDPFDPQSTADFFDPHWMFGRSLKDGFDIVIGNPPYIQIQKFPSAQKAKWEAQNFVTYAAMADIYCLFYERGRKFIHPGGHICYITSNKWMRAGYGDKLRSFFVKQTQPKLIIDFGGVVVFNSATVDSVIVLASNSNIPTPCSSVVLSLDYRLTESLEEYIRTRTVSFLLPLDGSTSWVVRSPGRQIIKTQVEAQGVPLEKWEIQINYGIKTGFNEAFYLTQQQRDDYVAKDPSCSKFLVSLLRGRYVGRYASNWDGTWMINSHNGIKDQGVPPVNLKAECPILWQHLCSYEEELCKRQDKGDHWSNLRNCAYVEEFKKPKIMYPNMTKYLPFYLDYTNRFFTNDKGFIINSQTESLPYLAAFLNSQLFRCCFIDNFPNLGEDRRELRKIFVEKIPVKKPTAAEVSLFERLVPLIQFAKSDTGASPGVAAFLEHIIDACVMECYFLEHMAERDLLFHDTVAPHLAAYAPEASAAQQRDLLMQVYQTLNAPSHPIRNRLLRLTADSPDLLAIIKQEGKV